MWQDYAFTVSAIIFGYGLLPQIKKNFDLKDASFISWQMCIVTMFAIVITGVTCLSLKLYISSSANAFQLVCWSTIIYQKLKYKKESPDEATTNTE